MTMVAEPTAHALSNAPIGNPYAQNAADEVTSTPPYSDAFIYRSRGIKRWIFYVFPLHPWFLSDTPIRIWGQNDPPYGMVDQMKRFVPQKPRKPKALMLSVKVIPEAHSHCAVECTLPLKCVKSLKTASVQFLADAGAQTCACDINVMRSL